MAQYIQQKIFEGTLKGGYQIALGNDHQLDLVLESTKTHQTRQEGYECFSLLFSGPKDQSLPQASYEMTNEQLGTFPLFIVPVRDEGNKIYYEALFNRPKQ